MIPRIEKPYTLDAIRWMTWLEMPMKGVTSYEMLWVVACIL